VYGARLPASAHSSPTYLPLLPTFHTCLPLLTLYSYAHRSDNAAGSIGDDGDDGDGDVDLDDVPLLGSGGGQQAVAVGDASRPINRIRRRRGEGGSGAFDGGETGRERGNSTVVNGDSDSHSDSDGDDDALLGSEQRTHLEVGLSTRLHNINAYDGGAPASSDGSSSGAGDGNGNFGIVVKNPERLHANEFRHVVFCIFEAITMALALVR
jgi:hypothetical protein